MRVMAVVCAPWSCGTGKCPFGFRRTCVLFRAEERTKEWTKVWRMRRVSQTPKGMDDSQTPKRVVGRSRGGAQFLAEVAGRSLSALMVVRSLPCAMSGGRVGDSSRETRSVCNRSVWRRRVVWCAQFSKPVQGGGRKPRGRGSNAPFTRQKHERYVKTLISDDTKETAVW